SRECPQRHRAVALMPCSCPRACGSVCRVACREPVRRDVPLVVPALDRVPLIPATTATDPRPPFGDDCGEPTGGGRERALFPRELGYHPQRRGHDLLPTERPPARRLHR